MAKYLKLFETTSEYNTYIGGQNVVLPNVSLCEDNYEVHYKPFVPMNIINYNASAKLAETTSNKSNGLHTNAFNVSITSHTFENGIGTIEFEDDVTIIGDYAFYGSSITSIDIPNSVTSIGLQSFDSCDSLTSVTISDGVTSIGDQAFYSCGSLTSVTIPNSVTSIGGVAFEYCSGLTSITIGSGVTTIGDYAFSGCTILSSVTVKAIVPPTLGGNVFRYNASGRKIYVPSSSVDAYKATSGWSDYASDIEAIPTT